MRGNKRILADTRGRLNIRLELPGKEKNKDRRWGVSKKINNRKIFH